MDEVTPSGTRRRRGREREAIQGILLTDGVEGGLVAGAIAIAAAMVVSAVNGQSVAAPWVSTASIVLGSSAFNGPFTWGIVFVGFVVHFAFAALYGAIWGAVANRLPRRLRDNVLIHGGLGFGYGLLLWVINIRGIALVVYPWLAQAPTLTPLLLHAAAYGLSLGLFLAIRVRPIDLARPRAARV
ncbi:hypothetical protein [Vulgatibacter incomptus]|uniref:Uncharacterized protein n=1 Tax=Vulgatibacter incomptus TaxID=1391653 RepID=A0A0K1PIH6_9BACT|nr:hypothetical protein [Vulgatibacter incomptus]AKU93320.1 hypothetical protein AKJ08_3707 [Vulgatibacter incomptus]